VYRVFEAVLRVCLFVWLAISVALVYELIAVVYREYVQKSEIRTRAQLLRRKILRWAWLLTLVGWFVSAILVAPHDPNEKVCLTIGGLVTNFCT
jgi:uncharacterized membrane protein YbhN (UPF0104 family)